MDNSRLGSPFVLRRTRRRALVVFLGLLIEMLCGQQHDAAIAAVPPNVILIVADDLGYGDLGCYGSKTNRTPNIDRLAGVGQRFTDFHSSGPMCTPTRVSILTGRYQQRFGKLFDGPLSGETQRHLGLPDSAVTVAELLKSKGYATGCYGKWHLGFRTPHLPTDQGFDEFRGLLAGDGDHHSHIDRYGNEDWWHNDKSQMQSGYTTELLTKYSLDFIRRNQKQPFFLYLPHLAIHFPWQGPNDPPHREQGKDYKQDKWGIIPDRSNVASHVKAMVEAIDASTGQLVAELNRLELTERTLVIFTSDNGGYLTYGDDFRNISSNGDLRGQKGMLYEGGHRVPLIACYPGKVKAATTSALVHSNDLLPTICSVAGFEVADLQTDGRSFWPLLKGQSGLEADFSNRTLYWRAGAEWAVREGPWKLVFEQGKRELFHLGRDLGEHRDLAVAEPSMVQRLHRKWKRWNDSMSVVGEN